LGFVYFCQGGEPVALVAVDEGAEDVGHRSASIGDLYEDHSSVGWVWTALGFAELMDGFKDGFAKDATGDV
jgi:hypothetical protein